MKNYEGNIILMPKFNLELFKTLILNILFIHSKCRKLGVFTLFQKYQFVLAHVN